MSSLRRGRNVILPGQYYDVETGLNYNYFRDYDPGTGRYVESDPIGLAGGSWSIYTYAGSDPIDQVDYFGLLNAPWSLPEARRVAMYSRYSCQFFCQYPSEFWEQRRW